MGLHKEFINELSINRLVPYYLMSSYLYYEHDKNVLDDTQFDYLCKKILDNWNDITHIHKHLLDKETLQAGSGYGITYTNMIMSSALKWYEENKK